MCRETVPETLSRVLLLAVILFWCGQPCRAQQVQSGCERKWSEDPSGVWLRASSMYCSYWKANATQCYDNIPRCCVDSDCNEGDKCMCHRGCASLICMRKPNRHCKALAHPKEGKIVEINSHRLQIRCDRVATIVPVESEGILVCDPAKGSEWQGKGECRRICGNPNEISHGSLVSTVSSLYTGGTPATYRCNPGYALKDGIAQSTCRDVPWGNGRTVWSAVTCEKMSCPTLNITGIEGLQITQYPTGNKFNDLARVRCRAGYELVGGKRLVRCKVTDTGSSVAWRNIPYCQALPCNLSRSSGEYIPASHNAGNATSVSSGTTVVYSCPDLHTLVGYAIQTCMRGKWIAPQPHCKPLCCKQSLLLSLRPGRSVNFTTSKSVCRDSEAFEANLKCDRCFHSSTAAAAVARCNGDEWEYSANISCQRVTCPPLPVYNTIGYGRKADSLPHSGRRNCGSSIKFSCQKSEILYGENESYCLESGTWSENMPTCISKEASQCPPFPLPTTTSQYTITNSQGNQIGSVATAQCLDPCFNLTTAAQFAICGVNKTNGQLEWKILVTPQCKEIQCMPYGDVGSPNTRLTVSNRTCGTRSKVACARGFRHFSPDGLVHTRPTVMCGSDGQWRTTPSEARLTCVFRGNCSGICTKGESCATVGRSKVLTCVCKTSCPEVTASEYVCGTNGILYPSLCHLHKAACEAKTQIGVLPSSACDRGGSCWQERPWRDGNQTYCPDIEQRRSYSRRLKSCGNSVVHTACHVDQGNTFKPFSHSRSCHRECIAQRICALPPDPGNCTALKQRFFFNCTSNTCEPFHYRGCYGNQNNFERKSTCLEVARDQGCYNDTHRCAVKYTPPTACCRSDQERFLNMCRTAEFAFTATITQLQELAGQEYSINEAVITDLPFGSGLTFSNGGALVKGGQNSKFRVFTRAADRKSSCVPCVLVPVPPTASMFLMGRRLESRDSRYITIENWSYGFESAFFTDGRKKICNECPSTSKLRRGTDCSTI